MRNSNILTTGDVSGNEIRKQDEFLEDRIRNLSYLTKPKNIASEKNLSANEFPRRKACPERKRGNPQNIVDLSKIVKLGISVFSFFAAFLLFSPQPASASVSYPIPELGNCRDQKECFYYCQIPENTPSCWSYKTYVMYPNVLGDENISEEEQAQKMGITFPIAELGNCANVTECKNYCGQSQNQSKCLDFAGKKGLDKGKNAVPPQIVTAAKTELGCDSETGCKSVCSDPANFTKCRNFAVKYGLEKETAEIEDRPSDEVVKNAKKELGCSDETSCQTYCSKPENQDKCFQFAKKHKLIKEEDEKKYEESKKEYEKYQGAKKEILADAKKELGCDSYESCSSICTKPENSDKCMALGKKHGIGPAQPASQGGPASPNQGLPAQTGGPKPSGEPQMMTGKKGPGGCNNEKECQAYCQKNPKDCPGFAETSSQGTQNTREAKDLKSKLNQSSTGSFLGPSGCKTEGECKSYCEKHPAECPGFPGKTTSNTGKVEKMEKIEPSGFKPPAVSNSPQTFTPQNTMPQSEPNAFLNSDFAPSSPPPIN